MAVESKIKEIADSTLNFGFNNKYTNGIALSGWIIQKPKYSENPIKKSRAVSFIIYQVMVANNGDIETNSFSCITYAESLFEKLLNLNNVAFVTCSGKLIFNHYKHTYSPHIFSLDIELTTDQTIEPMYKTKNVWEQEK